MATPDLSLDRLLDLDGVTLVLESGYWVKFEVQRVEPTVEIPHGIKYSLTFHDPQGKRVVGYDNAHVVKIGRGPGAKASPTADHKHLGKRRLHYPYTNAGDLLEAFWCDVDRYKEEKGV